MSWLFEPLAFDPADADAPAPSMDHAVGGRKPSQFSPETARIVLARAARGETMASILALPNMAWHAMRDQQALARQREVEEAEPIRALLTAQLVAANGWPPRAKAGRKSTYTRAAAEAWCDLIAGGATLREAGRHPGLPDPPMVYRWLRNHPEFRAMYKAAAEHRDFVLRSTAADLAIDHGYAARPQTDALIARAAALLPDVWR